MRNFGFSAIAGAVLLSDSVLAVSYDYVIIGGGTCGLVIANRLTELPNVSVAIIEAGDSVYNNPNVTDPGLYSKAFGTSIDYAYSTTNQTYANNLPAVMRAGKAVGGTSTINGMAYTRSPIEQIDSWESALGNVGWNWTSLFPYYLKHENFTTPSAWQLVDGATYIAADHGYSGPVKVGWRDNLDNSTIFNNFNKSNTAVGLPFDSDVNGGHMHGFYFLPKLVDRDANLRADAGRAYYWPYTGRNNLHMYLNTYANKIVWNSTKGTPIAGGVQIAAASGAVSTIYANKEVIVSAGSMRSPIILELSGVGNPTILKKYNIPVVVNLTTVGENLQDQTNNAFYWKSNTTLIGSDVFVAYPSAKDLFGTNLTNVANDIKSKLSSYASKVSAASGGAVSAANMLKSFTNQYNLLFTSLVPATEFIYSCYSATFDVEFWSLLPFSRGSVHIGSPTFQAPAVINPNYFMLDWDMTSQIASGKLLRKVMGAKPVSSFVVKETIPLLTTLPTAATDSSWSTYLKAHYRPNWHPVGSLAMLPRNIGGVVSNELKLYGTSNVRVIDASVLPFQVCGHLTSTLYAIAEKAADIIKAGL